MFEYPITIWLSFFITYSFFGWIWEVIYESIKAGKLINRGFLNGPLIPIYGVGSLSCLIIYELVNHNPLATFVLYVIVATTLELVTGITMEKIFKVRYWDYTDFKGNIKGYICPQSSLFWGFLSYLLTEFIHPAVSGFILGIDYTYIRVITYAALIYFIVDFAVSVFDGLHLRALLGEISRKTLELGKLRNVDLNLFSAIKPDNQEIIEKYQARKNSLENHVDRLTKLPREHYNELLKAIENAGLFARKNHRVVNMLRRNPTAVSKKYPVILKQIQNIMKNRR